LLLLLVDAVQVYTEVEIVGDGLEGPDGGYLDLQEEREQEPPGQ